MTKELRVHMRVRVRVRVSEGQIVSSINGVGKIGYLHAKLDTYLIP